METEESAAEQPQITNVQIHNREKKIIFLSLPSLVGTPVSPFHTIPLFHMYLDTDTEHSLFNLKAKT